MIVDIIYNLERLLVRIEDGTITREAVETNLRETISELNVIKGEL